MFASCILNKRQINTLKRYYSRLRSLMLNRSIRQHIRPKLNEINASLMANEPSPFQDISYNILEFLNKHKVPGKEFEYRYSENTQQPTLYASVYACMTLSLLGRLNTMQDDQKLKWMEYFNSYQNRDDGLFYDPVVDSTLFRTADWWGARHLALHMISAYTDLGGRPKYQFRFLEKYYNDAQLKSWLDSFDWSKSITHDDDIDNKIMNIGCLLQYQRDIWSDEKAGSAVAYLQKYLMNKINPETGMWGRFDTHDPEQRSRMVQFAYHLFPLFFYDNIQIKHTDKIIQLVMATQNELGGFGVKLNSSACEDIDSIDILIRLSPLVPDRKKEIDAALKKALGWVLCNQVDDGGFVFRLNEPFVYGHPETSSKANQGAMFPTWFRTLCLAYIMNYLDISNEFIITRAPGYEL
jgi:prenyltransferase beta subunit